MKYWQQIGKETVAKPDICLVISQKHDNLSYTQTWWLKLQCK